jgi:hypothetical protein
MARRSVAPARIAINGAVLTDHSCEVLCNDFGRGTTTSDCMAIFKFMQHPRQVTVVWTFPTEGDNNSGRTSVY